LTTGKRKSLPAKKKKNYFRKGSGETALVEFLRQKNDREKKNFGTFLIVITKRAKMSHTCLGGNV